MHRDLPDTMQDGATRLFEDKGPCTSPYEHEGSLTREEVIARWAEGRGLVVWAGHGSAEGVYRTTWLDDTNGDGDADANECGSPAFLESPDSEDLEDVPGAFTWHISCSNGTPAQPDNIGTELLYGGAAATATASTPAFGVTVGFGETWEPRPDLATSATAGYYYALNVAAGMTAGEALAWTKYALPGDGWVDYYEHVDFTGAAWTTRMQYNLYGDPTRSLELCEADADCDDGSACNGSEACSDGFCVHHDPIDCGHLDADCTVGSCDADSGECVSVPRHEGTPCDDGMWCTEGDSCEAGECGGAERDCGERDGYLSWCDEETDSCEWEELESEPAVADDDDDTTSVIDLEGSVVDPYLDGAGVGDAWLLVDTGTEQISARTAADGTFLIPDVPDTAPIVLTVAGEDRQAVTWSGLVLADTELPIELSCTYRATTYYDFPTMRVTVEVTDAPVGSWVFVSGDGLYDYPYAQVTDESAVEIDFEVTLYDPAQTTYTMTALVQDGTTGELVGGGATTVEVDDEVTATIDAGEASPAELDVTVNQPLLDGEALTDLDTNYMSSLGLVYLGGGALAGWTRHWSHGADGFDLLVDHVPVEGHVHHLGLYLAEDLTSADAFAYAQYFDETEGENGTETTYKVSEAPGGEAAF